MKLKALFFVLSLFAFAACSSSSSSGNGDGGKDVGTFEAKANGVWISDCRHDQQQGYYREMLTLKKGGNGSSQYILFAGANCGGNGQLSNQADAFTYKVKSSDGRNSTLEIQVPGQNPLELNLVIDAGKMTVTWPFQENGKPVVTIYQKAQQDNQAPGEEQHQAEEGPQTEDARAFDQLAKGGWKNQECLKSDDGRMSYFLNVNFIGGGSGYFEYLVFNNTTCSGFSQTTTQALSYKVDHFRGTTGQITLNNEIMDIMFNGPQMKVITAQGQMTFTKQ